MASDWQIILQKSPLVQTARQILSDYREMYIATQAAALSYYALFSIVPLSFFLVLIVTRVFGQSIVEGDLFGLLVGFVGPQAAEQLQSFAAVGVEQSGNILGWFIALVLLWWTASGMFVQLSYSLNRIWRRDRQKRTSFWNFLWQRGLASVAMAVVGGVFLLTSLLGMIALSVAEFLLVEHPILEILPAIRLLELGISSVLLFGMFMVLYRFLPVGTVNWRPVIISSLMAMVLVMIAKYAIGYYLEATNLGSPYGAAGSVVVLMFWFYLMAQIFLSCGLIGRHLGSREEA